MQVEERQELARHKDEEVERSRGRGAMMAHHCSCIALG
jgi:hypothetical protein